VLIASLVIVSINDGREYIDVKASITAAAY